MAAKRQKVCKIYYQDGLHYKYIVVKYILWSNVFTTELQRDIVYLYFCKGTGLCNVRPAVKHLNNMEVIECMTRDVMKINNLYNK